MSYAALFTTICMIIVAIVDAVLVLTGGVDNSISRFMQSTGFAHPSFIFAFGFLAGHFWGAMPPKDRSK